MFFKKTFLLSVLILGITFGVTIPNSDKSGDMISLTGVAFAQSPPDLTAPPDFGTNSTSDMSSPDFGTNSTSDMSPPDLSGSDLSGSPSLNDTIPNPGSDLSGLDQNITALPVENMSNTTGSTPNSSVPEFGSLAAVILVVAVMSFVVVSARTRLRFMA